MGILAIILINLIVVVGGGELADKTISRVKSNDKKFTKIFEEVQKKTTFNIKVAPVINFKPNINVKPTIESKNDNANTNTNDNVSDLDFGEEGGLKK